MPYTSAQVLDLVRLGESPTLELKSSIPRVDDLARLISAFSNTAGGTIIVGITERGEVPGVNTPDLARVFHRALGALIGAPRVDLESVSINGKDVGVVTIENGRTVTVSDFGAYQRIGSALRAMSAPAITNALREPGQPTDQITVMAKAIARLTVTVESMNTQLENSNSPLTRVRDHIISGVIGAIIGIVLGKLF